MATKKKVDLETETALKAVEDALSSGVHNTQDDPFAAFEADIANAATDLRENEIELKSTKQAPLDTNVNSLVDDPALMAANDDRKNTVEDLVYGLQQKPSSAPYWLAGLFSVLWIGVMYFYTQNTHPTLLQNLSTSVGISAKLNDTTTYLYLAGLVLPIFLAFGFAMLMRRASEMKIAANSMTVAAVKLLQPEDIANESITAVGYAVRREVKAMGDGMNQALARASELEGIVKDEVLHIERAYADSEIKIGSLVNDLATQREAIVDHADKLRSSIGETHSGLTNELDNASTVLKATVEEAGLQLTSALSSAQIGATSTLNVASDSLVEQISAAGTDAANLLNSQTLNLRDQSNKITQDIEDSIGLRVSEFSSRLDDTGSTIQTMLDKRLDKIEDSISVKGDAFVTALGHRTEALDKVLSQRNDAIGNTMADRLSTLSGTMSNHIDSVVGQLKQRHEALESSATRVEETVASKADALEKQLVSTSANIEQTLTEKTVSIESTLTERAATIENTLSERAANIENTLTARTASMDKVLSEKSGAFINSLAANSQNLENSLDERTAHMNKALAERTASMDKALNEGTANMDKALNERNETFINTYAAGESGIRAALDESARRLSENVDAGKQEIEIAIDRKAADLVGALEASKADLSDAVESKYGLFSKMLEEKRAAIEAEFTTQMGSASNTIDERSAAISDILSDRANLINETLGKGLADSQRLLNEKSNEINHLMSERTSELKTIIEEQAVPLAQTIKTQGEQTAAQLSSVNEIVQNDVAQVIQKLGIASEAMGSLLIKATSDMNEMQDNITSQAEGMSNVVANAKENVAQSTEIAQQTYTAFDERSGNILANIGVIAERFDHQSSLLQHAASLLESTEERFSSSVGSKNESLKQLAEGLVLRTGEIENSMEQFSSMLTRTMDDAAQRSRLVGSNIAEEVKLAMEDTHARFTASSEAMRQAALDVQRDLDDTREQMRRGVIELPEETKQSADSMRKVVADQIAALRDLSEIVSKSGKALDAAPHQVQQQQVQQAAPYQQSYQAPVQQVAQPAPIRAPQQAAQQAPLPTPRMPSNVRQNVAPATAPRAPIAQRAPAPRAAPRVTPAPQMQPNQAQGNSSGWVSDLLRRADAPSPQQTAPQAPNQPRSELHMVESLNSLSMDIARQIDHEASIDLWERYQRGERNVFTRRLYTMQGQQTFDEIQAKYASEPEFRMAVDRYMMDFEKLLEEVAKNDRDGMMTQTYLTSDTGKVYTMLAHASGRLGN